MISMAIASKMSTIPVPVSGAIDSSKAPKASRETPNKRRIFLVIKGPAVITVLPACY